MPTTSYGHWDSPLAPEQLAKGNVRYGFPYLAPDGGLYYSELRSAQKGRTALVSVRADGAVQELLPQSFGARTRVHEYGGASFCVWGARVYFVNQADQQVWWVQAGAAPRPLTQAPEHRFAELTPDPSRGRLIAVTERHAASGSVDNQLVAVDVASGAFSALASGRDFYAAPALCPAGAQLAYLAWDHPHMPWDAAELHLAQISPDGVIASSAHLGGDASASALQPTWSPHGRLFCALERQGRWALHVLQAGRLQHAAQTSGELGTPLWQLGARAWAFADEQTIVGASFERGGAQLLRIEPGTGRSQRLRGDFGYVGHVTARGRRAVFALGWSGSGTQLIDYDLATGAARVLRSAYEGLIDDADVSQPEAVEFPTSQGEVAYGFFYAPRNQRFVAPSDTLPPLIVTVHGGPTASCAAILNPSVQFFTTRGYAVLDVNYRGSSGYGRAYRDRLGGQWGVLDVDDCVAGARFVAGRGRVDPRRLLIRGGSAGGYTVLQALANHDVFAAGACHYGISDLEALARDTHKFESHYDRFLVGPYPERRDVYVARSPIHYVERIRRPVIFFQGLDDKVVPADQTRSMAETLRTGGVDVEYHAYAGEQHGFRNADTIADVLRKELAFFERVLGL